MFEYTTDILPRANALTCASTFEYKGKLLPENDKFAVVPYNELEKYINEKQYNILKMHLDSKS